MDRTIEEFIHGQWRFLHQGYVVCKGSTGIGFLMEKDRLWPDLATMRSRTFITRLKRVGRGGLLVSSPC